MTSRRKLVRCITTREVYIDISRCPKCQTGLLRPGVVWFGEDLPQDILDEIDEFIGMIYSLGKACEFY